MPQLALCLETSPESHPWGLGIWTEGWLTSEPWATYQAVSWVTLCYITEHILDFVKADRIRHWLSRCSLCRELSENLRFIVFSLSAWAHGPPGEFARKSKYHHKPLELEYPGMELVICLGLVIGFRMCCYDKQVHVGDCLKKILQWHPQISKC